MYLCFVYRNFLPQQISLSPSVRGQSRLTFHDSFRLLPLWQERPIICISTFHVKSLRPLKLESLGTLVIHIAFTSFYRELPNPCAPPDYHPKNPKFYTQPYNAERRARRQNDIRISHVLPVPQRALCVPLSSTRGELRFPSILRGNLYFSGFLGHCRGASVRRRRKLRLRNLRYSESQQSTDTRSKDTVI